MLTLADRLVRSIEPVVRNFCRVLLFLLSLRYFYQYSGKKSFISIEF